MSVEGLTLAKLATTAQIAGAVTSTVGSYNKAKGEKAAANYNAAVARNNADLAQWNAEDALRRGQTAKQKQQIQTNALKGRQRAALAERGIDLGEGSALQLLTDTDMFGAIDANTIEANAAREAFGYKTQATNFLAEMGFQKARGDAINPVSSAFTSALTGAGQVAKTWYTFSSKGGTPSSSKKKGYDGVEIDPYNYDMNYGR